MASIPTANAGRSGRFREPLNTDFKGGRTSSCFSVRLILHQSKTTGQRSAEETGRPGNKTDRMKMILFLGVRLVFSLQTTRPQGWHLVEIRPHHRPAWPRGSGLGREGT